MKEEDPSTFPIKPLGLKDFGKLFGVEFTEEDERAANMREKLSNEKTPEEERFRELILSTQREGAEHLLFSLEHNNFFWVPASVVHTDNAPHGLLKHSLKVYDEAMKLREEFLKEHPEEEINIPKEGVLVSALLHDVCKCDEYTIDGNGRAQKCDYVFPIGGHGTKSLIYILGWGFKLEGWEKLAIRWHMGSKRIKDEEMKTVCENAKKDCPLLNIIIRADYNVTH